MKLFFLLLIFVIFFMKNLYNMHGFLDEITHFLKMMIKTPGCIISVKLLFLSYSGEIVSKDNFFPKVSKTCHDKYFFQ